MPDITMCKNIVCPLSDGCYRSTAKPNAEKQAYVFFDYKFEFYDRDGYSEIDVTCDHFIDNKPYIHQTK